jgi:hypothetical protein
MGARGHYVQSELLELFVGDRSNAGFDEKRTEEKPEVHPVSIGR